MNFLLEPALELAGQGADGEERRMGSANGSRRKDGSFAAHG
jgi:hypothetical protein